MNETKRNDAPGSYQTGAVSQPPSYGGVVTLLLVAVVVLGGIITILGLLNIRLFVALKNREADALSLQGTEATRPEDLSAHQMPRFSLELADKPNLEKTMRPQELYANCLEAVVSVQCDTDRGTGMVLTDQGYILTNYSLVWDARQVTVELADRSSHCATVIGTDPSLDLAVLYVESENLTAPVFADSDELEVGDAVSALGDPLGSQSSGTLTTSTVSDLSGDTICTQNHWKQTGPLLDAFGRVVGLHVKDSSVAISSATIKTVAEQLINQGYVSGRPNLGIRWEPVPELHQNYYKLPPGMYVTQVIGEIPLSVGDILVSLNGMPITSEEELLATLNTCRVGDVARLEIFRNGRRFPVSITIVEGKD